jgi:hypothetical protein
MPHPERAILRAQVPIDLRQNLEEGHPERQDGPGLHLFSALVAALGE